MGGHRLSSIGPCAVAVLSVLLASCGGGGGTDAPDDPPAPRTWTATSGTAEKGPLIIGSAVTAQELDASLSPTGKQYSYQIVSDLGIFTPTSAFTSQYLGVSATGYYFDEVLGAVSSGPVTLNGYSDLSVDGVMNVNILTTLAYQRVRMLVTSGKSFAQARAQAEDEVLESLKIHNHTFGPFSVLKISGNTEGAKLLAAISALFVQGNNAGELSQLINNFQSDIAQDGDLDDEETREALAAAALTMRPAVVAANLNQRFASAGVAFTADDLARWIDDDADGEVGELSFKVINANAATVFTLPPNAVASLVGKPLEGAGLIVNGVSVSSVPTVNASDVIAVRPGIFSSGQGYTSLTSGFARFFIVVEFLAPVASMEITPADRQIRVGTPQQFGVVVHFSDGSTITTETGFGWSSSNPAVASIWFGTSQAQTHSLGITTVTAEFGPLSVSTTLEVVPVVLEDFSVTPGSVALGVALRSRARLIGTYSDGATVDVSSLATWQSADPQVAAVDAQTGVITGVALGQTTIEATIDSVTRTFPVHVSASGHVFGPSTVLPRTGATATLLPNGKVLLAGGEGLEAEESAEVYDPETASWSTGGTLVSRHGNHEATLMANGNVLITGGHGSGPAVPFVDTYAQNNTWSLTTRPMRESRISHTATGLPGGKVLVAGGNGGLGPIFASTELYDPGANTWSDAASMNSPRALHTATAFADGKVFVAGGWDSMGTGPVSTLTASTELYDPVADAWTLRAPLLQARIHHTATALPDGRILVAGGMNQTTLLPPEIYDPATNSWSPAGNMATLRIAHTALLLPNGKVMVAGGLGGSNVTGLDSVEIYDPATNSWSPHTPLKIARGGHTATLLGDGSILIVGGRDNVSPALLSSSEIYW